MDIEFIVEIVMLFGVYIVAGMIMMRMLRHDGKRFRRSYRKAFR